MTLWKSESSPVFGIPIWYCSECGQICTQALVYFLGSVRFNQKGHLVNCRSRQNQLKESIQIGYWVRHKRNYNKQRTL
jgi:hypothetical protein